MVQFLQYSLRNGESAPQGRRPSVDGVMRAVGHCDKKDVFFWRIHFQLVLSDSALRSSSPVLLFISFSLHGLTLKPIAHSYLLKLSSQQHLASVFWLLSFFLFPPFGGLSRCFMLEMEIFFYRSSVLTLYSYFFSIPRGVRR